MRQRMPAGVLTLNTSPLLRKGSVGRGHADSVSHTTDSKFRLLGKLFFTVLSKALKHGLAGAHAYIVCVCVCVCEHKEAC